MQCHPLVLKQKSSTAHLTVFKQQVLLVCFRCILQPLIVVLKSRYRATNTPNVSAGLSQNGKVLDWTDLIYSSILAREVCVQAALPGELVWHMG